MTRLRWDERAQAYLQRRTAQGLSKREIIRCLKRYVSRELFEHIQSTLVSNPAQPTA
jgi:hypothetical protein